jgi:plasmid stabilization system protein ParE
MTFTVVWRATAEAKLAELWLSASDRDAVTRAADAIVALLRSHPRAVGEAREAPSRIQIVPPLAVYYDVIEDDRVVAVWAVWRLTRNR